MKTTPEIRAELRVHLSREGSIYGRLVVAKLLDDVEELQSRAEQAETMLRNVVVALEAGLPTAILLGCVRAHQDALSAKETK